jgi:anti-sigma factor RsiW
MTCLDLELDIGDYVDGTLDAASVARVETHVRHCRSCQALVEELRTLRGAARSLEPQIPPAHLWPRVAAAIEVDARHRPVRRLFSLGANSFHPGLRHVGPLRGPAKQRWPAVRIANRYGGHALFSTAAIVALLLGGVWVSWRSVSTGDRVSVASARKTTDVVAALAPVDEQMQDAEQHYTRVIASLEQIAKTERTTLDTPVAAVVDQNLAVLDQAIGESRDALQKEPSSELAQNSLFEALRSKVSLLQETIALINEMRKGNPDGAARIVSEMNEPRGSAP